MIICPQVWFHSLLLCTYLQFTETRQQEFKLTIADAVTKYCQENSKECQAVTIKQRYACMWHSTWNFNSPFTVYRREAFVVTSDDVVLTDIANNAENNVTFIMYILVNDGFEVLHIDALEPSVNVSREECFT